MSTTLRQVLEHFEQSHGAVSLPQMARTLGIERETLQNMIEYWMRKGKLREITAPACTTCGSASRCPFIIALPRCYELVAGTESSGGVEPVNCACGDTCH